MRPFQKWHLCGLFFLVILLASCADDSDSYSENLNDWEWVQLQPSSSPPARYGHAMVYAIGPFIYGGEAGGIKYSEIPGNGMADGGWNTDLTFPRGLELGTPWLTMRNDSRSSCLAVLRAWPRTAARRAS